PPARVRRHLRLCWCSRQPVLDARRRADVACAPPAPAAAVRRGRPARRRLPWRTGRGGGPASARGAVRPPPPGGGAGARACRRGAARRVVSVSVSVDAGRSWRTSRIPASGGQPLALSALGPRAWLVVSWARAPVAALRDRRRGPVVARRSRPELGAKRGQR